MVVVLVAKDHQQRAASKSRSGGRNNKSSRFWLQAGRRLPKPVMPVLVLALRSPLLEEMAN